MSLENEFPIDYWKIETKRLYMIQMILFDILSILTFSSENQFTENCAVCDSQQNYLGDKRFPGDLLHYSGETGDVMVCYIFKE